MNLSALFGKSITGLTSKDIADITAGVTLITETIAERFRDNEAEIADLRRQVEALRSDLAVLKREPRKPFAQKLREKGTK